MNLLSVKDLSIGYFGKAPLLEGVSFELNAGECVRLEGPNGAGKSTLLRTLVGALSNLGGEIRWEIPPDGIAYLPQLEEREVFLPVTLKETLFLKDHELSEAYQWGLFDASFENTPWNEASGGERKRTFLTRLLLSQPDVLILDEPFNHLDSVSREKVLGAIEKFLAQENRAVLLVHHGEEFSPSFPWRSFSLV